MAIKFAEFTHEEHVVLWQIIDRAQKKAAEFGQTIDRLTLDMDISAACADVPLDLPKLLAFGETDFVHDVWGIRHHIDRTTGKLGSCFMPRCAKR